ncbi:DEAD/DEAH box helicase [Sharpea azabuensis]|uniref:DEAD/DEAH box helicase n=1 Tax=Sharpea azabuensis TaxID=322505 RepID=UPI003D02A077
MSKNNLINQVNDFFITGSNVSIEEIDSKNNKIEKFYYHVVERLIKTYNLFLSNEKYLNDFLISLRDYLLTLDTELEIPNLQIDQQNDFGLIQKGQHFYAVVDLEKYDKHEFVEDAFLRNYEESEKKEHYNLATNPKIYQLTGFKTYKSLAQKIAVQGALNTKDGYTTIVSLPTGGGKSLITQALAYSGYGLTIVVVPTVSLAIDQYRAAIETIKTEDARNQVFYYTSNRDSRPILEAIDKRKAKLLFISPESLMHNDAFRSSIESANESRYLRNIIIDEAHIVIDWGTSFRTDYQCLQSWRKKIIKSNNNIRTILLSATLEDSTVLNLKKMFSEEDRFIQIRCDSLRHEPRFMLIKCENANEKNKKMIELIRKLPHPMIVYFNRIQDADDAVKILKEHGLNNIREFTGNTNSMDRETLIEQWRKNEFEIMVATSAFGIGVDKSDVRTVLHMCVPPNPNAYYQELGRGGRDGLPCLSVMCITPASDIPSTKRMINTSILSYEKMVDRWNAMYSNEYTIKRKNILTINPSVKPSYLKKDEDEEEITNEDNTRWNIYVLLLFHRYNLITIDSINLVNKDYSFKIYINDPVLTQSKEEQSERFKQIRTIEYNHFNNAFQYLVHAIEEDQNECWSEMFYDTYSRVELYCAGCNNHKEIDKTIGHKFPLRKRIDKPLQRKQRSYLFSPANNEILVLVQNNDEVKEVISKLAKEGLSVLVCEDEHFDRYMDINDQNLLDSNLFIIDSDEVFDLNNEKEQNFYYLSGLIAIVYSDNVDEAYSEFKTGKNCLTRFKNEINVVHIMKKDFYFEKQQKKASELIDGRTMITNELK